jgi:hypothetical protein
MRIAHARNKHGRFIRRDRTVHFRDDKIVISSNGTIVFGSTFLNPNDTYQVITEQLSNATHQFRIVAFDDIGNESSSIDGSILIPAFASPPRYPKYSYVDRHHVKLSWTAPSTGAPDNYVVFSNWGSGSIDTTKQFDLLSSATTSVTYNLPSNGTWKFRIEAYKSGLYSSTEFELHIVIPRANYIPPSVLDENIKNIAFGAEPANAGKIKISFPWIYGDAAAKFRLYHDNGTGTVDYTTYFEFTRANGIMQTYTTTQLYDGEENKTFLIVIRAVTSDGVEESNVETVSVTIDGQAPDPISGLTIGSTF